MAKTSSVSVSTPKTVEETRLQRKLRDVYTRSPSDWRDQVFYFLLVDRFSNGKEKTEKLLKYDLSTEEGRKEISKLRGSDWMWNKWQLSGASRFQGGTIKGIASKLSYLNDLGITTLWVSPLFRQRVELDTYHGYGIQNFFDIDPRFGTINDLINLVDTAHSKYKMSVILDVIFNHSGSNWLYDPSTGNEHQPPYRQFDSYNQLWPRNGFGTSIHDPSQQLGNDDYIWPKEFQHYNNFMRAGSGNLGAGSIEDEYAEHKRTDFCDLRKFNLYSDDTLRNLIYCYQHWIAQTDIDGFRIDTFKHVTLSQARAFCNGIKEFAEMLGKDNFFLVAEIAGGDTVEDRYLDVTGRNLSACLDIGENREVICNMAKGLQWSDVYFRGFNSASPGMESHRSWGSRHLSISNDHDHVFGSKIRLSADASNDHQAAAAAAIQLFTLGIPCIYYGMEQGFASGAEPGERQYLSNWGGNDCLLREAMFGPEHPLASGYDGVTGAVDNDAPGFGPHGTSGWHTFNTKHPIYKRISMLAKVRAAYWSLRRGRQYARETSVMGSPYFQQGPGEIIAWSRVFDDQEVLVILNTHGTEKRGAMITIDSNLSSTGMTVVVNTDPDATGNFKAGGKLPLSIQSDGRCVVEIDTWLLGPSEVIVCANDSAVKSAAQSIV
jgi:glycosidase